MLYIVQGLLWPLMRMSLGIAALSNLILYAVSTVYVFAMTDEQLRRHRDRNKDTDND